MSSRCIKGRKKEKPRSALLSKRLCTRQFSFECFFAVTAEKCTKKCGARSELFCNCTQKCVPCTWRVAVLLIKPTDILTFRLLLSKALYWTPRTRTLLARKRVAIRGIFMNWESNRDVFPISKALDAVLTRINVNIFIVIYQLFLRW